MTVQDFTLYDVLLRNAQAFGQRIAIVSEKGESTSFAELLARVDRLALGLAQAGFTKGDRICVLAQNSAAYLDLYFACARLGTVVYPLNWRLKPEELQGLLGRAVPKGFAVDQTCVETVPAAALTQPSIQHYLSLDPKETTLAGPYQPLETLYVDGQLDPEPEVSGNDPFCIIATAAVETIPRGAILSHSNLVAANLQEIAALGLGPEDGNLVALPLFHIAGLGHCLSFLHAGGKNVITAKFDAAAAVELIDDQQLTHISDFPPILASVLDAAKQAGSRLETLRHVSGLDSPDTMQRLLDETGADFWTGFGQTETSGFVTLQRYRDLPGAAGKAAELSRIRLADDTDRDVPTGGDGEILVRGPLVFLGYADEPEVTEQTFRNGWHHTGDVGRFDEQGNLYYVKRKPEKELIKPGGENVYPAEVETIILELEGTCAVCVFGVPHERWGEGIKAVVQLLPGFSLTADEVIEHVGNRIARYKKPHFVDFTEALPRNQDGAVDRDAVKDQWS